jgi:hypothetical protein
MANSARLVAWRWCGNSVGEDGAIGYATVQLVEIALEIDVMLVRRHGRLRVELPRGALDGGSVTRPVLRWSSAEVGRQFAAAVLGVVASRYRTRSRWRSAA